MNCPQCGSFRTKPDGTCVDCDGVSSSSITAELKEKWQKKVREKTIKSSKSNPKNLRDSGGKNL